MNELALFSGAGGGILGGTLLGWRTVCAVEINAFCARRLMQRQNEGHLPSFPIWEAAMGWPIRWTDCRPLETVKFQQWLSLHGKSSPMPDPHAIARIVSEQRIGWQAAVRLAEEGL